MRTWRRKRMNCFTFQQGILAKWLYIPLLDLESYESAFQLQQRLSTIGYLSLWLWSRFTQCVKLVILSNMPRTALKYSFSSSFMGKNLVDVWWSCTFHHSRCYRITANIGWYTSCSPHFYECSLNNHPYFPCSPLNSISKVRRWSLYIVVADGLSTSKGKSDSHTVIIWQCGMRLKRHTAYFCLERSPWSATNICVRLTENWRMFGDATTSAVYV